jgi:serine phosphatase RsbU (regulator of sigma subunit)
MRAVGLELLWLMAGDEHLPPAFVEPSMTHSQAAPQQALVRLLEVALELSSADDLDHILRIATTGVCDAVGCERASLFVYDERRQELYTRTVTELEIAEIRHRIDAGIAGWVARHCELQNVPDPRADARWDHTVDRRTGFHTQNILAAPVILSGEQRVLGVLQLLNKPGGFNAFDEQVIRGFAAHVALALDRFRMQEELRAADDLRESLEMGRKIQSSFLPRALPNIPGYEVASWWQPAEFVSGDYYDWLPLPDGRYSFLVGDVSGHGLAAALIMASVRAMVHVLTHTESAPERILQLTRASIASDLSDSRFITFLLLALNLQSHEVAYANAGHGPAYRYHAASRQFHRLEPTATPIGFPQLDLSPPQTGTPLAPGDMLVLGTDGLIEVRNARQQMFGVERLLTLIRELAPLPLAELVRRVSVAVREFHGRPLPPDDTTLVVVRRQAV